MINISSRVQITEEEYKDYLEDTCTRIIFWKKNIPITMGAC